MGILDFINPFKDTIEQAGKTVDKLVLDKDLAAQLKTEIELVSHQGTRLALELEGTKAELDAALQQAREKTHQIALGTQTIPWVDAFHKLARTLLSFYSLTINAGVVLYFAHACSRCDGA